MQFGALNKVTLGKAGPFIRPVRVRCHYSSTCSESAFSIQFSWVYMNRLVANKPSRMDPSRGSLIEGT